MQLFPEYIKLIRSIGIPSIIEGINSYDESIERLAKINKVHYLYLTINKISIDSLEEKYKNIMNLISEIVTIFNHNAIEYVIFKTLKPFPYIPSDIDILIEPLQLSRITMLLHSYNYIMFIKDSLCLTMKKNDINVDLYVEPSVSDIPYLSRKLLMRHKIHTKINNNITISKLADYAEFVAVMCHSFYKEQMFTLSDYYTLTILAESSNTNDIIALSKETNCLDVLNIISNICKKITLEAFGRNDLKICELADMLIHDNNLVKPIYIKLPYKFSVKYVTALLFEKIIKEKGMISAFKYFTKSLSLKQLKKLVDHIKRETY